MKIISGGNLKNINVLTYFKLYDDSDKLNEYIFYTKELEEDHKTLYVANLEYKKDRILLVTPASEILEDLKTVIENLVSDHTNNFIFSKCEYEYKDIDYLEDIVLEEKNVLKMKLSNDKFNLLSNNKFLTYPFSEVTKSNIRENEYLTNNNIAIGFSTMVIIALYIGILIYHFVSKESINFLNFNDIKSFVLFFSVNINTFFLIKLSILILILSAIAYNNNDNHPFILFIFITLIFMMIYVIYYLSLGLISFNNSSTSIPIYKMISILSLVHSLIVTIPYMIFKTIINTITNKIKIKNYITFHTMFIILFIPTFLGLTLFYNNYLCEYVYKFIFKIM